jgi:WD40 repeat protein
VVTASGNRFDSKDNTARVWEAASGKELVVLRGHQSELNSAAFSADGARVVTTSFDKTARVWEAASGKQLAVLRGHEGSVTSAAFSPDGARVLTASADKTARVWEAASGKQLAVLRGHDGAVRTAAFSRDGAQVVTASWDSTARVWPVFPTTQELVNNAKQRVPRCLTAEQRTTFFLPPEPPAWCIEMEKWPYHTQAWKDWLKFSGAKQDPPLPDTPEWESWAAARQRDSTAPGLNPK